MKYFIKRTRDFAILENIEIPLGNRTNLFKMASLAYNLVSAPVFNNLIKYAFYKSGYTEERPDSFINVRDTCFKFSKLYCEICEQTSFICCAYCKKILCFTDFYINYCAHFQENNEINHNLSPKICKFNTSELQLTDEEDEDD